MDLAIYAEYLIGEVCEARLDEVGLKNLYRVAQSRRRFETANDRIRP